MGLCLESAGHLLEFGAYRFGDLRWIGVTEPLGVLQFLQCQKQAPLGAFGGSNLTGEL